MCWSRLGVGQEAAVAAQWTSTKKAQAAISQPGWEHIIDGVGVSTTRTYRLEILDQFPPEVLKRVHKDYECFASIVRDHSREVGQLLEAASQGSVGRARDVARRLQITEEALAKQGLRWLAAVAVVIVLACIGVQDGHYESEEEEVPLFEDIVIE